MTESTNTIASLKRAANYAKLAMHQEGPRSFKRGQGALLKVIYKFGEGSIGKDEAKKVLGWRGCDVRAVAKKAADNGYLTIESPEDGFQMSLTPMGAEIIQKRMTAEDKAADAVMEALSDAEKQQLIELCDKISKTAEEMGVDYSRIQKKHGRSCGKRCNDDHDGRRRGKKRCCKHEGHGHGHGHCCHHDHHDGPKYVFVFEEGGHHHGHHEHGHKCHHKH